MNPNAQQFLSTEVICALAALAGVILSALISWLVACRTSKTEFEKMRMTWEREDAVSSDDEFAEMADLVSQFVSSHHMTHRHKALGKVSAVRSKESGAVGAALDKLYNALEDVGTFGSSDIAPALSEAIEQKRKAKGQSHS